MAPAEPARLRVELVWSPAAGDVRHQWLDLAAGCTLGQALRACEALAGVDLGAFASASGAGCGRWTRRCASAIASSCTAR